MTADDKYPLLNRDNLTQLIRMHLSQQEKTFPQCFCTFLKSTLNFINFRKKVTLIAYVFWKFWTLKDVVR